MGLLNSADVDFIRECLDDVSGDVEQDITYRRYSSMTPGDPVFGTPDTPVYADAAITATARELTLEEIQVSGGVYVLGDMEFKIRQAALASAPAYADRIIYAGATFKPKSISRSFLGGIIGWTIRAGKQ